jgi:hypothetical protein
VHQAHAPTLQAVAFRLRAALLADPILAKHTDWVRVQARTKAAYSAYTKMQRKAVELDALDDLLGLRVIFKPTVTKKLPLGLHRQRQCMLCYRVLEVTHAHFPQAVGRRLKDYVTTPKPNGYQSLHSTVVLETSVESSMRAELQVRTGRDGPVSLNRTLSQLQPQLRTLPLTPTPNPEPQPLTLSLTLTLTLTLPLTLPRYAQPRCTGMQSMGTRPTGSSSARTGGLRTIGMILGSIR